MDSFDAAALFLLADLQAPVTADMRLAIDAWCRVESGGRILGNNPWNIHSWGGLIGQTGYRYAGSGDKNVATFDTLEHGVKACAGRLLNPLYGIIYGYARVVAAARASDPVGFCNALARSSWSASRYGTRNGGTNSLLTLYAQLKAARPKPAGGERMIYCDGLNIETDYVIDLPAGAAVYEAVDGSELKRFATPETVTFTGNPKPGSGWRAVVIRTASGTFDGKSHQVQAYVRGYEARALHPASPAGG